MANGDAVKPSRSDGMGGGPWSFDASPYVQILKLGSIGLAFLLAAAVVYLLIELQKTPGAVGIHPGLIYATLAAFVVIFGLFLASQYFDQSKISLAEYNRLMAAQREQLIEIIETMKNMHMVSGKIVQPKETATHESRKIECSGTVSKFHKESGLHLWLAVEIRGGIWPKGSELAVNAKGEWSALVFQDGSDSPFSLDLLVVDERTHAQFLDWIHEGKFDRIAWPKGALRLDRVDGLRLKEKP